MEPTANGGPGDMQGLLFITHKTEKYDYLQSIEIALEGGCKRIQLRMKDELPMHVMETARKAKEMCDQYSADLYIDDYVGVAMQIMARGVHLGKKDVAPKDARNVMWPESVIGGTANTFEDIVNLNAQGVNYIGLGPFRFTDTKKNLSPILGLEGYRRIMEQCREAGIDLPVMAIGGITYDDIPAIMQTGVSGIALSSTILRASDPVSETKRIIEIINENKR